MSYETKLGPDLVLSVSIRGCIENLSSEDRQQIISAVAMDRWFLKAVVDQLVDGMTESGWAFDKSFYTELRLKLADHMESVGISLIRELSRERDAAKANEDRHVRWAWELYQSWMSGDRGLPPSIPAFVYTNHMDDAKAMELLLAREGDKA